MSISRSQKFQPQLEALEQRFVLSTTYLQPIAVSQDVDSSFSLRAATDGAEADDGVNTNLMKFITCAQIKSAAECLEEFPPES